MSMKISEISSETAGKDTVQSIQSAKKSLTEFFDYINDKRPTIGEICRKYKFETITLKTKN